MSDTFDNLRESLKQAIAHKNGVKNVATEATLDLHMLEWIEYMFQREIEDLKRADMPLYAEAHKVALEALREKYSAVYNG